jgi:predicted porin
MKNKLLIAGIAAAAVVPASAQAFEFTVSGQVNQAVVFGGDTDDAEIVDNNTSGSRFRFKGSKAINDAVKAGFRYEMQDQDNVSSSLTDREDTDVRVSQIYLSGDFGKFSLGKGSSVSDGIFEAYSLINYMGGAESAALYSGTTAVAYSANDGLSRKNIVRYDSPNFGGFSVALGTYSGGGEGIALRYKNKVAGGTLVAQYSADEVDGGEEFKGGSIGYKSAMGLSASYSFAERDDKDDETEWLMVGYSFGNTTISYGTGESGASTGSKNEMSIIGVNYKPVKGMEIYFNRMNFDNADGVDGDTFSIGSRVKF